jgi:translation initiation factor IF-3
LEVLTISKKEMQINEEIREKEVRLLGPDSEPLGFFSSKEALEMAVQRNLDLVMIAPAATPPVCRIMDYGKYRFEQAKREKEAKKKQKVIEIKEVRMGLNIDVHDFNTKVNQAVKFMNGGDRVKVSIRFRGRELAHTSLGNGVMERFAQACGEAGNVEKQPKMEGRSMVMFMSPKPTK